MSESLNSGPLPGSGIDCRVQRMALALRCHYSSIDRPALKSKSHLVAQAIVSGSGDNEVCLCVGGAWCVCACASAQNFSCVSSLWCFPRLLFAPLSFSLDQLSFSALLSLPLSLPSPTSMDKSQKRVPMCVSCVEAGSLDPSPAGIHLQTR